MKTWIKTLAVGTVLALGLTACDDGTPDLIDDAALRADAALVAADAMFQDLAAMQPPTTLGLAGAGPELGPTEGGGSYNWTRNVTFYVDDVPQDAYDALETDSIHVEWDFSREAEHTFWSADIERHRDMWITGLEGEETERTWNGIGNGEVFKSQHPDDGVERTYNMTTEAEHSDVVRKVPRAENPYPVSGTITRHIHAVVTENGEVVGERDVTTVITFDGTQLATVTVGEDSWTIDLAQRGLRQRFGRKGG
ncbi:hypothetical protein ACFL3S_12155 [Gemmatimonadota bacterium]